MDFDNILEPIREAISGMIARAVIRSFKNSKGENGPLVAVELPGQERHEDVPFMQHYGVASFPPKDSELLLLFPGGCRGAGVAMGSQSKPGDIPQLEEGESCLYSKFGQKVVLKKDGSIVLTPASGKTVTVESDLKVTGAVNADGNVESGGSVKAALNVEADVEVKALASSTFVTLTKHIHPSAMGPTSAPTPGM